MMRALSLFARNQHGAAGAEMALVLPLLLVLMFGSFEIANYFWLEHQVVKAVRDGARFAGRQTFTVYACDTPIADSTIETQIKNLTTTGEISGGTTKVSGWANEHVTVTVTCPDEALDGSGAGVVTTGIYRGMANAPIVTVSTTVAYPSLFAMLGFDTTGVNLAASSRSAVMGL